MAPEAAGEVTANAHDYQGPNRADVVWFEGKWYCSKSCDPDVLAALRSDVLAALRAASASEWDG